MSNYAVRADDVWVQRGGSSVLRGVDFSLLSGTVTGLLGPSGCGKTTLLRAIVGLQRIRSGRLDVLGRPAGTPSLRQEVGYASQAASVYTDLTVVENVRYFAAMLRVPRSDVQRVLSAVDMVAFAHRIAGRLSGGQRSRVSLAVALLGSPALVVLDEPTVGLDPILREQLWALFGRLAHDGVTLLVSSHVMDGAERCDELFLMREGRLLARDTPAALLERTGTDRMDAAFLRLIDAADSAAA